MMHAGDMWDAVVGVPSGYAMAHDEVHVWRARTGWRPADIDALSEILAPDERQKAARFYFPIDRERHVIGRAMVRVLLGHLIGATPDDLRFSYNGFGKPYLADDAREPRLEFNVSHSGDLILVGLSFGRAIGVDVEQIRGERDVDGIAGHFFSAREQADLAALDPALRHDAFFSCWSRKEAFIKARGEGLSLPLDQFDVSLVPGEPARLLATRPDPAEAAKWTMRNLDAGPGHKAALVVEGAGWTLKTWEWLRPS